MQTTSQLYQRLITAQNHYFESAIEINGVMYPQSQIFEMTTDIAAFGADPEIGKAVAQEINVRMIEPEETIPPMAVMRPFTRVCADGQHSEWLPQGVFYIDTRETDESYRGLPVITLHGFDAMLKTEQDYADTQLDWPATDISIVREIASKIGVAVDDRTVAIMTAGYTYPLPTGYTLREYLGYIAADYTGCFILTEAGALRLVAFQDLPEETNYLIDKEGSCITFGGDRILV